MAKVIVKCRYYSSENSARDIGGMLTYIATREGAEKFVANVNNIKNRGYELEDGQIEKMPIALTENPEQLNETLNVADANGLSLYSLYSFAADVCTMRPSVLESILNI